MSQHSLKIPEISYDDARASVVLWKKGRKKKPNPTHFINSVWNLVYRYNDRSFKNAAEDVKEISPRMLMKLAAAAEVVASSRKIKKLLEEERISLEAVGELARLKNLEKRDEVAESVIDMNALDQIQIFRYAKRHPHASFEQFRNRVLTSKDVKERIYMAILPLTEEEYKTLKEEAGKLKMSWDGLCMKIIKDWLGEKRK